MRWGARHEWLIVKDGKHGFQAGKVGMTLREDISGME